MTPKEEEGGDASVPGTQCPQEAPFASPLHPVDCRQASVRGDGTERGLAVGLRQRKHADPEEVHSQGLGAPVAGRELQGAPTVATHGTSFMCPLSIQHVFTECLLHCGRLVGMRNDGDNVRGVLKPGSRDACPGRRVRASVRCQWSRARREGTGRWMAGLSASRPRGHCVGSSRRGHRSASSGHGTWGPALPVDGRRAASQEQLGTHLHKRRQGSHVR